MREVGGGRGVAAVGMAASVGRAALVGTRPLWRDPWGARGARWGWRTTVRVRVGVTVAVALGACQRRGARSQVRDGERGHSEGQGWRRVGENIAPWLGRRECDSLPVLGLCVDGRDAWQGQVTGITADRSSLCSHRLNALTHGRRGGAATGAGRQGKGWGAGRATELNGDQGQPQSHTVVGVALPNAPALPLWGGDVTPMGLPASLAAECSTEWAGSRAGSEGGLRGLTWRVSACRCDCARSSPQSGACGGRGGERVRGSVGGHSVWPSPRHRPHLRPSRRSRRCLDGAHPRGQHRQELRGQVVGGRLVAAGEEDARYAARGVDADAGDLPKRHLERPPRHVLGVEPQQVPPLVQAQGQRGQRVHHTRLVVPIAHHQPPHHAVLRENEHQPCVGLSKRDQTPSAAIPAQLPCRRPAPHLAADLDLEREILLHVLDREDEDREARPYLRAGVLRAGALHHAHALARSRRHLDHCRRERGTPRRRQGRTPSAGLAAEGRHSPRKHRARGCGTPACIALPASACAWTPRRSTHTWSS